MTDNLSALPDLDDPSHAPDRTAAAETTPAPVDRTGNQVVDRVLDSLDALEEAPVAEHVAVFEAAHDQLRCALAGDVDDSDRSRS